MKILILFTLINFSYAAELRKGQCIKELQGQEGYKFFIKESININGLDYFKVGGWDHKSSKEEYLLKSDIKKNFIKTDCIEISDPGEWDDND